MSIANKVFLIGYLGQDPELRRLESGRAVIRFTLATKERWKDTNTGEWKEETDWHTVKAWGPFADLLFEKLRKGHKVLIWGRLKYDKWEKNGVQMTTAYVLAEEYERSFPDPAKVHQDEQKPAEQKPQADPKPYPQHKEVKQLDDLAPKGEPEEMEIDDLPF